MSCGFKLKLTANWKFYQKQRKLNWAYIYTQKYTSIYVHICILDFAALIIHIVHTTVQCEHWKFTKAHFNKQKTRTDILKTTYGVKSTIFKIHGFFWLPKSIIGKVLIFLMESDSIRIFYKLTMYIPLPIPLVCFGHSNFNPRFEKKKFSENIKKNIGECLKALHPGYGFMS